MGFVAIKRDDAVGGGILNPASIPGHCIASSVVPSLSFLHFLSTGVGVGVGVAVGVHSGPMELRKVIKGNLKWGEGMLQF